MKCLPLLLSAALAVTASAASLPGFRPQLLGSVAGYATSIVVDSNNIIYYTTTSGSIFRFANGQSLPVAKVTTEGVGNSGLLGMALQDDNTAIVHYTTPHQTYDVISRINLTTGEEQIIAKFAGDIDVPERGVPSEHHGGNPTIAPDGTIFVGIGDYGQSGLAKEPGWNAGKVFRIDRGGTVTEFASGFRNPYDLVWDDAINRLVVGDNGPVAGDEIHIVIAGANCGWPYTYGDQPPHDGSTPPDYVFARTVAPTGMALMNGANDALGRGLLVASFVTRALFYFPDVGSPMSDPIAVLDRDTGPIIDVTQATSGDVFFTTGTAIYRLLTPARGDCDGDGLTTTMDIGALEDELADDDSERVIVAQDGKFPGSWGCDADGDGFIRTKDLSELMRILSPRRRAARSGK